VALEFVKAREKVGSLAVYPPPHLNYDPLAAALIEAIDSVGFAGLFLVDSLILRLCSWS
jgi:hypothetical protein